MIRKQIYLRTSQQATVKRLAQARGLSEAEVIRQAIEHQVGGAPRQPAPPDPGAWQKALDFMLALKERGPLKGQRRRWKREDLYEERLRRYGRRSR